MSSNVRPETMERITNEALANAFIDEQVAALRAQIGDKKVLHCPAVWTARSLLHC